jgi:hypothetical protein
MAGIDLLVSIHKYRDKQADYSHMYRYFEWPMSLDGLTAASL